METSLRIDKYLWSARVYKTRKLASEACRTEKVMINGILAKPAKSVKINDIIEVKVNPIIKKFKVVGLPKSRCSPKIVDNFIEDLTDEKDLETLKIAQIARAQTRGAGRPTKKDRRMLDRIRFSDDTHSD